MFFNTLISFIIINVYIYHLGIAVQSNMKTRSKVVFLLHGIRTQARWQNAFVDVAQNANWKCPLSEWFFGRFSIFQFFSPWSREAKVRWFRKTYNKEVELEQLESDSGEYPSIIAHSFGTYILGNALLKYDYLRFDKVILCGSILPRDFPWDDLIKRGQVQAVRNEYGVKDIWAGWVSLFISHTDASGTEGFTCEHERFEQQKFEYDHSEYFDKGHMKDKWIKFLDKKLPHFPFQKGDVKRPTPKYPFVMYSIYLTAVLVFAVILVSPSPPDSLVWPLRVVNNSASPTEVIVYAPEKNLPVATFVVGPGIEKDPLHNGKKVFINGRYKLMIDNEEYEARNWIQPYNGKWWLKLGAMAHSVASFRRYRRVHVINNSYDTKSIRFDYADSTPYVDGDEKTWQVFQRDNQIIDVGATSMWTIWQDNSLGVKLGAVARNDGREGVALVTIDTDGRFVWNS